MNAIKKNWTDAIKYCNSLELSSYSDWRLPNKLELQSITDKNKFNPAIKLGIKYISPEYYWSNDSQEGIPYFALAKNFKNGEENWIVKKNLFLVRCVRNSN